MYICVGCGGRGEAKLVRMIRHVVSLHYVFHPNLLSEKDGVIILSLLQQNEDMSSMLPRISKYKKSSPVFVTQALFVIETPLTKWP